MKKILTLIGTTILLSGCTQLLPGPDVSTAVEILNSDVTGNSVPEIITIEESDIVIVEEFAETYPYTFTHLYVHNEIGNDANPAMRQLLAIGPDGITSESGDQVSAKIGTREAYAAQFGEEDFMYVVQIDSSGQPISEPLTINWDAVTDGWSIQ